MRGPVLAWPGPPLKKRCVSERRLSSSLRQENSLSLLPTTIHVRRTEVEDEKAPGDDEKVEVTPLDKTTLIHSGSLGNVKVH